MKFSKLREYPLLETSMFVIMSYSTYLLAEFAQLTGVCVCVCGWVCVCVCVCVSVCSVLCL